jgi:2-dehydropantoate 2-reductase
VGGALAEAGHDVTLISRNRRHMEAIDAEGLILRTHGEDRRVRLAALVSPSGLGPVDLVVVSVKSLDTENAIQAARPLVGPDTVVMSLQNGLGQEAALCEAVGARHVVAGKTYVGGVMLGPGHVLSSTDGKETVIGELNGALTPRIEAIAAAFSASGLVTHASANIIGAMWDKLFVNVATGAVAAITGLAYGDLYAVAEIEQTAIAAVAEGMEVAGALGVATDTADPCEPWVKASSGLPREFRTSMLQSLDKGTLTEIDFINGAIVRAGAKAGVPTPVNATLVALVKGIERRIATPAMRETPHAGHGALAIASDLINPSGEIVQTGERKPLIPQETGSHLT